MSDQLFTFRVSRRKYAKLTFTLRKRKIMVASSLYHWEHYHKLSTSLLKWRGLGGWAIGSSQSIDKEILLLPSENFLDTYLSMGDQVGWYIILWIDGKTFMQTDWKRGKCQLKNVFKLEEKTDFTELKPHLPPRMVFIRFISFRSLMLSFLFLS